MSAVISVRIPKVLKNKLDKLREHVNWSKEIRKFIEARVKEVERELTLQEVERVIESLPEVPISIVTRYVREARDGH